MSDRTVALIRRTFDDGSGFDTGASHALLERASDGFLGETFRISVPGRVVAFGKRDLHSPGFRRAVDLTRQHGFSPVIRLPGGRAAAFHEKTISFSWTVPDDDPVRNIRNRFAETAAVITQALERIGVPSLVGEVAGEYCPGEYTVNHAGEIKLAGIGQRLARNATHVGGVLVVGDATRIQDVLVPVYGALDLAMNPKTIGAVADVISDVEVETVINAIIGVLSDELTLIPRTFDTTTLERAQVLAPLHIPGTSALA